MSSPESSWFVAYPPKRGEASDVETHGLRVPGNVCALDWFEHGGDALGVSVLVLEPVAADVLWQSASNLVGLFFCSGRQSPHVPKEVDEPSGLCLVDHDQTRRQLFDSNLAGSTLFTCRNDIEKPYPRVFHRSSLLW